MTQRKTGLSAERHQEIGLELARMHDQLTTLTVEIMNAYPKDSRPHSLASGADDGLDKLRSELDSRLFAEHENATADAYYPPAALRDSSGT